MQNNNADCSTSNWNEMDRTYAPEMGESYVERDLHRMYTGTAPTMHQVRQRYGDTAVNLWLTNQLRYMFELSEIKIDQVKTNSLIRLIRAKYSWLKLTEFMHYVFLFRTGEFGKVYGKADGQTVMLTLKDYCKIRDDKLAEINARCHQEQLAEYLSTPKAQETENMRIIANLLTSADFAKYGEWRKEPWASQMARAFFVDRTIDVFPGDMTFEQRQEWALMHRHAV